MLHSYTTFHENVVRLLGVYEDDSLNDARRYGYIMEFMENGSLYNRKLFFIFWDMKCDSDSFRSVVYQRRLLQMDFTSNTRIRILAQERCSS